MTHSTAVTTGVNTGVIHMMRLSGASLQQIADRIGRSKERVRQILVNSYGSTQRNLLSTEQLHQHLGLPRQHIMELYEAGIIAPANQWQTGSYHFMLWHPETCDVIILYYKTQRLCKICHHLIPTGRRVYCSKECYQEGQKYRNKSPEAKAKRLASIRRCVARHRHGVTTAAG